MVEIPINTDELLGVWSFNRCPVCGHRTLINKAGDEWCGNSLCFWCENPEDEKILVEIFNPKPTLPR